MCGFDIGCHVQSSLWGLVGLVPWWAWVAIAVAGLGVAYRLGGWPAVAALVFGYGWAWGRYGDAAPGRPGDRPTDRHEHVAGRDADPPQRPPRRKRPTLIDLFTRNR